MLSIIVYCNYLAKIHSKKLFATDKYFKFAKQVKQFCISLQKKLIREKVFLLCDICLNAALIQL
jgi:hypothetical protein